MMKMMLIPVIMKRKEGRTERSEVACFHPDSSSLNPNRCGPTDRAEGS